VTLCYSDAKTSEMLHYPALAHAQIRLKFKKFMKWIT